MLEPGLNEELDDIHLLEICVMSFTLMLPNAHLLLFYTCLPLNQHTNRQHTANKLIS